MLLWLTCCGANVYSQNDGRLPITIGYFGHYAIQPGVKVGTEIRLKTWTKERMRKNRDIVRMKYFSINPQLAWFTRLNQHANYLLNVEAMYHTQGKGKKIYTAFTVGLGYWIQSKVESFSINLATGEKTNKQRASSHFLIPSLGFEWGGRINGQINWYNKYTWGQRFFSTKGNGSAMSLFLELGVKLYLLK